MFPTILAVGRLVETKGFHTLVRACGLLNERGLEFRCTHHRGGARNGAPRWARSHPGPSTRRFPLVGERHPAEVLSLYPRGGSLRHAFLRSEQ